MSVQSTTTREFPRQVQVNHPMHPGETVVAAVVDDRLEATAATGPVDVLTVDIDGTRWLVDAAEADAFPPRGGKA